MLPTVIVFAIVAQMIWSTARDILSPFKGRRRSSARRSPARRVYADYDDDEYEAPSSYSAPSRSPTYSAPEQPSEYATSQKWMENGAKMRSLQQQIRGLQPIRDRNGPAINRLHNELAYLQGQTPPQYHPR